VAEAVEIVELAQAAAAKPVSPVAAAPAPAPAPAPVKPKPEADATGDLFAGIEHSLKAIQSDLDALPIMEDEPPKKRGRPKKEEAAAPVIAPAPVAAQPSPPKETPVKSVQIPVRIMFEYFGFVCDKCSNDKMRVSLFDGTDDSEAYCCACGFNEKFKISAPDRADVLAKGTLRSGTLPASALPAKETAAAKKAAPVVTPVAAATGVITTEWTDPKTGKLMLVESWMDAEGEEFRRVREAPVDLPSPSGQWSDGTPAVPSTKSPTKSSAPVTQPTTKSTETSSAECKSEPPKSSPSPNPNAARVAESVMAYQPPPVDLDGARAELRSMVIAWPLEKQIEKFEKVMATTWDDQQVHAQIDKLVSAMLGVFG
jgi:hypothetical protein